MKESKLKLSRKNLKKWKKKLEKLAIKQNISGLSGTMSDEEWIKDYLGMTPEESIDEEIWAMSH